MCITTSTANLTATKIYVGEANHNDKYVHVLAYQNKAISHTPNAMVLPFPIKEKMGRDNVIDTTKFEMFLDHISQYSRHRTLSRGGNVSKSSKSLDVFTVGSYTIVLADSATDILSALEQIPQSKRPKVSREFLEGYDKLYPNHQIALCCWEGSIKPEPLLFWYEPKRPDVLFVPTMDAHNGNAPNVDSEVHTDHVICVGSSIESGNVKIMVPYDVKHLMPNVTHGVGFNKWLDNGDFKILVEDLKDKSITPSIYRVAKSKILREDKMVGWS